MIYTPCYQSVVIGPIENFHNADILIQGDTVMFFGRRGRGNGGDAIFVENAAVCRSIMASKLTEDEFRNAYVMRFDSYGELIERLQTECKRNRDYERHEHHDNNREFRGTHSWDEYMDLAHKGWSEGRQRIEALVKQIEAHETFAGIREEWNYDVAGHSLDIARYCAGEPEQWGTPVEYAVEGVSNKIINLYLHVGALWPMKQERMFERAAMVAALVNILENCGFRVALNAMTCAHHAAGDGNSIITYTTLKQAEQTLDLERVAIALHPSTFRRALFMVYDLASGGPGCANDGYGQTRKHPVIDEPGAIIINSDEGYFATDVERIDWLKEKVANVSKAIADKVIVD